MRRIHVLVIVVLIAATFMGLYAIFSGFDRTGGAAIAHDPPKRHRELSPADREHRDRLRALRAQQENRRWASRLRDACGVFFSSNLTATDLSRLVSLGRNYRASISALALCEFSVDESNDIVARLAPLVQDGSEEAAAVVFAIAGSECDETPETIEHDCLWRAQEEVWQHRQWRACLDSGYRGYRTCTVMVMKEFEGLPTETVIERYLTEAESQLNRLISQARDGSIETEVALRELERRASDFMLVESVGPDAAGGVATELVMLVDSLRREGDDESRNRAEALMHFWARRYDATHQAEINESLAPEEPIRF